MYSSWNEGFFILSLMSKIERQVWDISVDRKQMRKHHHHLTSLMHSPLPTMIPGKTSSQSFLFFILAFWSICLNMIWYHPWKCETRSVLAAGSKEYPRVLDYSMFNFWFYYPTLPEIEKPLCLILDWIVGHTFGKYTWLCGKVSPRYAWHESGGRRVCPQSSRQVLAWKQDLKHGFSFTCSSPLLSIIWGCRNATMAEMRFLIMKKFLFHVIPCCTLFVQESGCIKYSVNV